MRRPSQLVLPPVWVHDQRGAIFDRACQPADEREEQAGQQRGNQDRGQAFAYRRQRRILSKASINASKIQAMPLRGQDMRSPRRQKPKGKKEATGKSWSFRLR